MVAGLLRACLLGGGLLGAGLLNAAGGEGYLCGVEELGSVLGVDGAEGHALSDTGNECVDLDRGGEERQGVAVGLSGVLAEASGDVEGVVKFVVGYGLVGEGPGPGIETALDGDGDGGFGVVGFGFGWVGGLV